MTEHQTGGRGRHGRVWVSRVGDLACSAGWTPEGVEAQFFPQASLVSAVAVAESLSVLGVRGVGLKWPNDILLEGGKLGGILTEVCDGCLVIGLGLNMTPADRGASLAEGALESGLVLRGYLEALAAWLVRWQEEGLESVRRCWEGYGPLRGTMVQVKTGCGLVRGEFWGLAEDGGLQLRTSKGVQTVHTGEMLGA